MKAPKKHIETYILHFHHKSAHRYFRSLDECIEYIFRSYEQTGIEPQKITLPSGHTVKYNMYAMTRAYLTNERINERQIIEMLHQVAG